MKQRFSYRKKVKKLRENDEKKVLVLKNQDIFRNSAKQDCLRTQKKKQNEWMVKSRKEKKKDDRKEKGNLHSMLLFSKLFQR